MAYAKNAALAEELRMTVAAPNPDREKIDDVIRRAVQAAREPGDAYAFGRICGAASEPIDNPYDKTGDHYRYFAWTAGAKEGSRTQICGSRHQAR
jgi:hypothetical protein